MIKFIGVIKKDFERNQYSIGFRSDYNEARFQDWARENLGKQVNVTEKKKPVSSDLRAYYFGPVLQVVKRTCAEWKDLDSSELHQIVKKLFFYFETYNPITKRTERFGRSVMSDSEWNNTAKAMEFLDIIREYLEGCGESMPDSEEYKNLRDRGLL